MNKTQVARWKKLADGLAANAWVMTPRRRDKLRAEVADFIDCVTYNHDMADIVDWDGNGRGPIVSDELNDFLWDKRYQFERRGEVVDGQFGNRLSCCVRAGFDVAVAPSCGVLGFSVGDLRAIFPRGLPSWVQRHFEAPIAAETSSDVGVWL